MASKCFEKTVIRDAGLKCRHEVLLNENFLTVDQSMILNVLKLLRDHKDCMYKQLIDLTAVDMVSGKKRFYILYNMLSIRFKRRLYIKVYLNDGEYIPSIYKIFSCAEWFEREVYDMFGIIFEGNPDLRRILTDYGFQGHPLRKDFPLTGNVEVRYDVEKEEVVYEPVKLTQEYRSFDCLMPWKGQNS